MSTEHELTPGGPPQLHAIPYTSEMSSTLQMNGGVNLMGKQYGMMIVFFIFH